MRHIRTFLGYAFLASLLLSFSGTPLSAQAKGPMTIQATAMGTSTQMGKIYNVNIHIDGYSTDDDRQTLIQAFNKTGRDGLVDALFKMNPKGRVRFASGGVGNDVKYIYELPSKNGRMLRLVTDRWVTIGEMRNTTRSSDYAVGIIELHLTPDGKGEGTLLPACRITMNKKKKQLEVETYQNPWKLTHFIITKD